MVFGPARPPVTEDVAEVIAKDIKSEEGHGATSEIPLAFIPGRKPADPALLGETRKQMMMVITFAVGVLIVLIAVWALA